MDEYYDKRPQYNEFTKKIEDLIKSLLTEKNFRPHTITSRTKEFDSLERKTKKEEKYEKLPDITDLSGVRITCYFSDDVDKVAEIIDENFIILPELSIDKRKTLDPDRFGYLSLHYVVELSDDRARLPEYQRFAGLRCEIQIRSILQHAWAEIEHDLGYKSASGVPQDIRRRFSMQAGLLELADGEFVRIREDLEKYAKRIEEQLPHSYENILIDNISLKNYISSSEIVKQIDSRIAYSFGGHLYPDIDPDEIGEYVETLKLINISTILELDNLIKQNEKEIVDFAFKWFAVIITPEEVKKQQLEIKKHPKPENIIKTGGFHPGITVFYLVYILSAKNPIILRNLLKFRMPKITKEDLEKTEKEVINTYNEIHRVL